MLNSHKFTSLSGTKSLFLSPHFRKLKPLTQLNANKPTPAPWHRCILHDLMWVAEIKAILQLLCYFKVQMHLSHFPLCFTSLRSKASKTECQHAVDLWLNSWRDTEELPCQSPQGLWRPSAPRRGSSGSKGALNLVILEANGRYQRLHINQGGTWRKTAYWSKHQAKGN